MIQPHNFLLTLSLVIGVIEIQSSHFRPRGCPGESSRVLCWSIYIMAVMNEGGRWPALCAAGWLCDGRSLNIQGERKKKFFSESLRATCGARESQGSCFQNKKQTASLKFLDTVPLKISSCLFTMVSISKCFHHRYFACQSEKTCIYISQNGDHCKCTVGIQ